MANEPQETVKYMFVIELCPLIFILNFLLHTFLLCSTNLAVIIPLFLFQINFVELQRGNNTHEINIREESRFFFIVVVFIPLLLTPIILSSIFPPPPTPATIATPLSRSMSPFPNSLDPSTPSSPQGCQPAIYECTCHS